MVLVLISDNVRRVKFLFIGTLNKLISKINRPAINTIRFADLKIITQCMP